MFCSLVALLCLLLTESSLAVQGFRTLANKCPSESDGSRCNALGKPWQHDGMCLHSTNSELHCMAPSTRTMKLAILARYRTLKIVRSKKALIKDMYIKGSGPGLSWEKSIKMKKSALAVDMWTAELEYTVDSDGTTCLSSTHCSYNQNALEFRIYTDESGKNTMKGPNFFIPLPVSQSLHGAASFRTPTFTVYPWFHNTDISAKQFSLKLQFRLVGSDKMLHCAILYPPSFHENVRKHYPLALILMPQEQSKYVLPALEQLFYEAAIDEVVVVTIEVENHSACDYHPFHYTYELRCKNNPPCHTCQKCWDSLRSEGCDKEEFRDLTRKCLWSAHCPGIGGPLLEGIQHELVPKLREMTANRLHVNFPQDRLSIIGYGEAGVLACYASITRPTVFGNAACMSPKFFLPMEKDLTFGHDIRAILKEKHDLLAKDSNQVIFYANQKYYIDSGDKDGYFFPLIDSSIVTDDVVKLMKKSLKLKEHTNILQAQLPNTTMDYMSQKWKPDIASRLRIPFTYFFKAAGGPTMKSARTPVLTKELYAQRNIELKKQVLEHNPKAILVSPPPPRAPPIDIDRELSPNTSDINIINATSIDQDVTGGILTEVEEETEKEEEEVPTIQEEDISIDQEKEEIVPETPPAANKCDIHQVPLPVFLVSVAVSVVVSVAATVALMCLRESNRRAAEAEEKEEDDLLDEIDSDDDDF